MKKDKIALFMAKNAKFFPSDKLLYIKEKLNEIDEDRISLLFSIEFKNPILYFILNLFIPGLDRMLLGQIGWGLLKLLTGGGFCIWWIYDMFSIMKKVRNMNFELLMNIVM